MCIRDSSWRSTRSHRHQLLRSQRAPRALRPQPPLVSRRRSAAALSSGCVTEGANRELRALREVPAGGGENTAPCLVCLDRARRDTFQRKRRPRWHTRANETTAVNGSNGLDTVVTGCEHLVHLEKSIQLSALAVYFPGTATARARDAAWLVALRNRQYLLTWLARSSFGRWWRRRTRFSCATS